MRTQIKISEEEFINWMEMPVTKRFIQYLENEEHVIRTDLGRGSTAYRDDVNKTGSLYLEAIYTADVYQNLQDLTFDKLAIEEEDEDA